LITDLIKSTPTNGSVLDVGCDGFKQVVAALNIERSDLRHSGVDYIDRSSLAPEGFTFKVADLNSSPILFENDLFDLVIASHLIEHVTDPIALFSELVRVCKPGGAIYIEAPSDRSLLLPGMPFVNDDMYTLSYFDDPTHSQRPWTPMAFYKLAKYFGCTPEKVIYNSSRKNGAVPIGNRLRADHTVAQTTRNMELVGIGLGLFG
jgi:SAM-dependent methyltransferase